MSSLARVILMARSAMKLKGSSQPEPNSYPKGYVMRKAGVVTFWLLFSFMFLVVVSTLIGNAKAEKPAEKTVPLQKNPASSPEAVQFALDFTKDYMTWTAGDQGRMEREASMAKYLGKGLDKYAGLSMEGLQWNSAFKEAHLRKIQENGGKKAYITFLVTTELEPVPVPEKKADKAGTKANADTPPNKTALKYFVVPVTFTGNTFGVFELPKFTSLNEETDLVVTEEQNLKPVTQGTSELREFLDTFFRTYASDSQEELSYMLSDPDVARGLEGSMEFVGVKGSELFEGKNGKAYIAHAEVVFKDPVSGAEFTSAHRLEIEEQKGRFLVNGMDGPE